MLVPGGRRFAYSTAAVGLLVAIALAALRVGEAPGRLSDWQALLLGIVQGATELLPISSSGHLILVPWIGDWHYLETHESFNKTFDVALHLGTLVAVILYFWRDVVLYVGAWFRSVGHRAIRGADERMAWYILAASIPAAAVGAFGESTIETRLGEPWQIAIALAVFGVLLWVADRSPQERTISELRFGTAFAIGISQVLSLLPGVSRSGITITTGRFAKLDRDSAARFSFLLLIPITFGAVLYKGLKHVVLDSLPAGSTGPFVVGTLAAAAVGLVAIDVLLGYVRRHDYTPFVIYRLIAAAVIVLIIASGWRSATF
ncbi:MAG: undecaprenyl-diphosphatase UppP [Actinomycetota bacterium]|nr:undecaprenyl-diphosphatase UppP [Actinomycetota bacterium]